MLHPVKINSIDSIGILPVYDLCIPGPHHYILKSGIVSHNSGFIYASSIVIAMQKLKLKEDGDGNKISDVKGIRSVCKVEKSRYSKPFESVKIKIPWETGMDPYSGLLDLFEKQGIMSKSGNKISYITLNGEEIKKFRKQWDRNDDGCLDTVMEEFDEKLRLINQSREDSSEEDADENDIVGGE